MNKFKKLSFLLAAFLLALNPINVFATEDVKAETEVVEVQETEAVEEVKETEVVEEVKEVEATEVAEEEVTEEVEGDGISPWALELVHETVKTGIANEFLGKDGTADITVEQVATLTNSLQAKIDLDKLVADKSFKAVELTGEVATREYVLKSLFNVVAKYDANAPKDGNVEKYFVDKKVLLGDKDGNRLEDVATVEEAIILAGRVLTDLFNEKGVAAKGLMWKVENKGNTVYMLGSIHLADSTLYPISKDVLNAFEESDELYLEVVLDDPEGIAYLQTKQLYEEGKSLKGEIGEELFNQLLAILEPVGMTEEIMNQLKPWALYLSLSSLSAQTGEETDGPTTAISAEMGVDINFLEKANAKGMPVKELESYKFQADLFDSVPVEIYVDMFKAMIEANAKHAENPEAAAKEIEEAAAQFPKMLKAWKDGDRKTMADILAAESESPMNKVIFGERDKNMADGIEKLLNSDEKKTYFVIVGAGHLAPENSATGHLTEKGFKVENLNIN